jgi:hypothetical protein
MHPRKWKTGVQTKTCTQTCIAALVIITKMYRPLKCLSAGEW